MSDLKRIASLILVAPLAGAPALAQESIETFHVQGNVHLLVGAGANVAVQIGADGVLVVDTGSRASREALLAAIRRLSDGPIRWIVNTIRRPRSHGRQRDDLAGAA